MQRKFFSGLALMMVLNVLIKPIAIFGIDAEVQNRVGTEEYGIYFPLLSLTFLLNILTDFGINNYTIKHVAQHPKVAVSYLGKILTLRVFLFLIYAVVIYSVAFVFNWNEFQVYLLSFLVLNQLFVATIAFARSYFNGMLMFKTEAVLSILDRLLLIILCGAILYLPSSDESFQIEWFVWIQTICYGLAFLVAMVLLLRQTGIPKLSFRRHFSMAIIRKSLPYALVILLMQLYTRTDSVMIAELHKDGSLQAGYYAQGFRLFDALFMFVMIFTGLLYPIFSKLLIQKEDFKLILASATKLLLGVTVALGIICFFNAELILGWIYDHDVDKSASSFQWLMLGFVGMSTNLLFGTLLTANGSLKFLNTVSAVGILINVLANILLIPSYGASGAAFATLITQGAVSLVQIVYCMRHFSLRLSIIEVAKFIGFTAYVWAICFFLEVESFGWFALIGLGVIAGMFVFGLLDFKQLKSIFTSSPSEEISEA